jgi:hypothetical protein
MVLETWMPVAFLYIYMFATLAVYFRKKAKRIEIWSKIKNSLLINTPLRLYYELCLDILITSLLNFRLKGFQGFGDFFSFTLSIMTLVQFIGLLALFSIVIYKCNVEKFPKRVETFIEEVKQKKRASITFFCCFFLRRAILAINVVMFGVYGVTISLTIHCLTQLVATISLSFCVFEHWYRALINLVMEVSTLFVFLSCIVFEYWTHNSILITSCVIILVGSQIVVSALTVIETIYKFVMWIKA